AADRVRVGEREDRGSDHVPARCDRLQQRRVVERRQRESMREHDERVWPAGRRPPDDRGEPARHVSSIGQPHPPRTVGGHEGLGSQGRWARRRNSGSEERNEACRRYPERLLTEERQWHQEREANDAGSRLVALLPLEAEVVGGASEETRFQPFLSWIYSA